MKINWTLVKHYGLLAIIVPLMTSCKGGGGGDDTLGALLGNPDSGLQGLGGDDPVSLVTTGTEIASMHTPEPATLIIMGSGFAAMMYARKNKSNKKLY